MTETKDSYRSRLGRAAVIWTLRLTVYTYVVSLLSTPAVLTWAFVGWRWAVLVAIATVGVAALAGDLLLRLLARWIAEQIVAEVESAPEDIERMLGEMKVRDGRTAKHHRVAEGLTVNRRQA